MFAQRACGLFNARMYVDARRYNIDKLSATELILLWSSVGTLRALAMSLAVTESGVNL
jgi:hypothetical protein